MEMMSQVMKIRVYHAGRMRENLVPYMMTCRSTSASDDPGRLRVEDSHNASG